MSLDENGMDSEEPGQSVDSVSDTPLSFRQKLIVGISRWLMLGGILASIMTVTGFLGQFFWFFDLFSHFRVQYFLVLVIAAVCLIRHRRLMAGVFICFLIANLFAIAPFYYGSRIVRSEDNESIRVFFSNVLTNKGDPERTRAAIEKCAPDIVAMVETDHEWKRRLKWLAESHRYTEISTRDDNFGVSLFSKFPIVKSEIVNFGNSPVPSIVATVNCRGKNVEFIITHPLPPTGGKNAACRDAQLTAIGDYAKRSSTLMLLGDLNTTPWSHSFRQLMSKSDLIDSSRGCGIQPTWPNYCFIFLIPIDHCLHTSDIVITDREVGEDIGSDHYPLIIDFKVEN